MRAAHPLASIAGEYFTYLGTHFPQQCASDEFYFFPRAEEAVEHLNFLDDLRRDRIQEHVQRVRSLLQKISSVMTGELENEIDRHLLRCSMESFLREYEDAEVWRKDPTLYVKIPLFAADQILSREKMSSARLRSDLLRLFEQVPHFLHTASHNLREPSETALGVASAMARDAADYFGREIRAFIMERIGQDAPLLRLHEAALNAWQEYRQHLLALPAKKSFAVGENGLRKILEISWRYPRAPEDILRMATEAFHETRERLRASAARIDPDRPWQELVYDRKFLPSSNADLLALYRQEVDALRRFVYAEDLITLPPGERVAVCRTPSYLHSLRATASYRAPLTGQKNGRGIFYITPGREDLALIAGHCPYLSAHETYPGHHLLDHTRLHHPNPIRRQIESPLFYEGWACYAETLLDTCGYIRDPRRRLVQLKRQLWRDLRAVLDVKLQTGVIPPGLAAEEVMALGFSAARAERQVRRFCMTPGYQLCYFAGMHEINGLRDRFAPQSGLKPFHDMLLSGGQIPFSLAADRMAALTA